MNIAPGPPPRVALGGVWPLWQSERDRRECARNLPYGFSVSRSNRPRHVSPYCRHHQRNWRGAALNPGSSCHPSCGALHPERFLGALLGAQLTPLVPDRILMVLFAALMLTVGTFLLRTARSPD